MKTLRTFTPIIITACLLLGLISCKDKGNEEEALEGERLPDTGTVLSRMKQSADLVTTELTLRKLAVYDTSESETFIWTDPKTWKYGERRCIVPVTVRIKYGYDLREVSLYDLQTVDSTASISVRLPKPKVIDAGYDAEINEDEIIKMSSGFRSPISHELVDKIRKRTYDAVLEEDFSKTFGNEIEQNAQVVLASVLQNMGWKNVTITVKD